MKKGDIIYRISIVFPHSRKPSLKVDKCILGEKIKWKNEEKYCEDTIAFKLLEPAFENDYINTEDVSVDCITSKSNTDKLFTFDKNEIDNCKKKLIENNIKFHQYEINKFKNINILKGEN